MVSVPLFVLFVSTGNAARSLIAETLLNAKNSEQYRARSAGTAPAEAIHPETRLLLESAGFDTRKLHPKRWQDFRAAQHLVPVDVIVTLSPEAQRDVPRDWPGNPLRVHWTLDDPLGAPRPEMREWKFRKCLSVLENRISTLVRARPPAGRDQLFLRLKDLGMVV